MLTLLIWSTTLTHAQLRQQSDLPQGVSASWWQTVQKNLRESEYHISKRHDSAYTSPNRAQNLRFVYEPNGFSATRRDSLAHLWHARLTFAGLSKSGTNPDSQHAHAFTLTAEANTLVAQSDAIVIKYCNDEKGMRQDFIVKRKPDGNGDLRLWLYAEMQGGTVSTTAEQISFLTESGAEAMRYSDLKVWDANQKRLKARFEKVGNQVAIVVSDRKAMYPITIDPLSTTPDWTAESNQAGALFGFSVASAGDVNGDGFSDVIVGAYLFDNGETDEGRAFVYHGSAAGLSTTPNWTAESNQANAEFGFSVASAGDVNGDGFSDVIVGANLFDNGETNEGRAFVYHGSASGLSTTPNWTAESNQGNAEFGYSVASAGDVNGDGFSDVIVGAYLFDNGETDEGRAFVYHGSASGLSTVSNWAAESNQADAEFGNCVASAGDVNGDGFSDVIVGVRAFDNGETNEGRTYVYHGSATGLSTTPNWTAEGNQVNAFFGYSVASAGDVNGDGFSDVIVGAWLFDNGQTDEGRAFVYHGSASGLSTTPNWTSESNQASANFGFSVASAGDVNGDGFSDVIVGARLFDNGETDEGRAYVYHGSASGLSTTPNWTSESNQASANFGFSVASAGDVNGDGFSDVIVGARLFANGEASEGAAFVYHGSANGVNNGVPGTPANAAWTAESNQVNAYFGLSVASAGDVNGDGFSDVIVGAYLFDNGETNEGRAFVYHGSASGLSTTPNWTAESNQANAYFGFSVASAGDVNGDGFSDVIVGAYLFENGESDEGGAFVYHGSAAGLSTTANWTGESNQVIAYLGYTVASAGDVNGDGYSDVIVGAWQFDGGQTDEGAAFVYYGNGGSGLRQDIRQFRPSTTTPIVPALKTNSLNSVTLQKRRQSIAGRSTMQLEFEVKPLGTAFNGLGLQNTGFSLHATGGTPTSALIGGLSDRTLYKWRVRQVEKSTGIGYILLPRSRWYYPAGVAPTESHFQVSSDALPLPVELSSFSAQRVERGVELVWTTASEKNNAGFEVQRRSEKQASEEWQVLGFVKGNGTTSDAKSYSFVDRTASGKVQYRLKQVDFDGTFEYSPVIEVEAGMPRTFELGQNYPNPFNPTTLISYQLPVASEVSLKVYDVLGREVMTLVNGKQDAGSYNLNFNASNLSSGVYFYRLQAGSFVQTKKMMLVK
jgi:hypothetical protein